MRRGWIRPRPLPESGSPVRASPPRGLKPRSSRGAAGWSRLPASARERQRFAPLPRALAPVFVPFFAGAPAAFFVGFGFEATEVLAFAFEALPAAFTFAGFALDLEGALRAGAFLAAPFFVEARVPVEDALARFVGAAAFTSRFFRAVARDARAPPGAAVEGASGLATPSCATALSGDDSPAGRDPTVASWVEGAASEGGTLVRGGVEPSRGASTAGALRGGSDGIDGCQGTRPSKSGASSLGAGGANRAEGGTGRCGCRASLPPCRCRAPFPSLVG